MDFDKVIERIKERSGKDVARELAAYRAGGDTASVDGFLSYLRNQGVIDARQFAELHAHDKVDMTATYVPATTGNPVPFGFRSTILDPGATKVPQAADTAVGGYSGGEGHTAAQGEPAHYEVLGELGKGAMGEVHLARDLVLRRKIALKSILPHMQQSPAIFGRFLGEMQITAQLDHPYIVPVYGVENGPSGGLAYAMKMVQGRELRELLADAKKRIEEGKPLDDDQTLPARLEVFLKVCDAIAYAHERGVVHRDLKPANIMLGPFNEVYVMDWGIARLMGKAGAASDAAAQQKVELLDAEGNDASQTTRTRVGSTLGTPLYMSPEQAAGKNDELDGRSDLYTLGLILQEVVCLTGAVGGSTLQEVLTNAKEGKRLEPQPLASGERVPRELAAIIDRATRRVPSERYASVGDLADDLRRYLRNEAVLAAPDTTMQAIGRWTSKHRMATVSLLMLTLMTGIGATFGLLLYRRAEAAEQQNREYRLAELQASSTLRAQELDSTLQGYESLFSKVAGAAGHALEGKRQGEFKLLFGDDFKEGGIAPGLGDSSFHGGKISFAAPVAAIAPGVVREAVAGDALAVESLVALAKSVMLESASPDFRKLSAEEKQRALMHSGTPITRISVTLQTGLHFEYPGMAGLAPDYDGRTAPGYQAALAQSGVVWGKPRPGRGGMVLPASVPLRSHEGEPLGVLSFEVSIERTVSSALASAPGPHVEASLLVEKEGKVLAQNGEGEEPELLDMQQVKDAIARGESGFVETKRQGRDVLVTYTPLSTVDWYLVTVANVTAMKKAPPPAGGPRPGAVARSQPSAVPLGTAPLAAPVPAAKPTASASAEPEPSAEPSAQPSASAAPSASVAPSAPALGGPWPTAQPSAPPSNVAPPAPTPTAPPDPFDPWKAYEKDKKP